MGIQKYMAFVKAVEYGSFSKAGEKLSYSQSGIILLPQLILKRIPYHVITKELDVPAYRQICLALKDKISASVAVKRFLDYLDYRNPK